MLCLRAGSRRWLLVAAISCAIATFTNLLLVHLVWAAEDRVVGVPSDDSEMNAAIEKARAALPRFWEKLVNSSGGEEGFAVKLKLSDGENDEHFWCNNIQGNSQSATCVIDNDPEFVKTVQAGQRVAIDNRLITDWMYLRGDRIFGGETIRVLLRYLPPDEASALSARLSEE